MSSSLLIITTLLTLSLSRCSDKNNKTIDVIQQKLDNMTLDEKIGQMIVAGFNGTDVNKELINLVSISHSNIVIRYQGDTNNKFADLKITYQILKKYSQVPNLK